MCGGGGEGLLVLRLRNLRDLYISLSIYCSGLFSVETGDGADGCAVDKKEQQRNACGLCVCFRLLDHIIQINVRLIQRAVVGRYEY